MWTQELLDFVLEHEGDDVKQLALRAARYPAIDVAFAIQQIKGRQLIKEKSQAWYEFENLLYPQHLSLEQASSEITAKYKANLCCGDSFVDLTGGLGVDFYFMSQNARSAVYVEQNSELVRIAAHNLNILPHTSKLEIKNDDSVSFLQTMSQVDTIYIDPARRDEGGRKAVLISDCTPNLEEIDALLTQKSKRTIIKLSPMLDISLALKTLTNVASVHVLSIKNECKELVFVKENEYEVAHKEIIFHCVNFTKEKSSDFTFSDKDRTEIKYTQEVLRYLYEPNSSVMKAGGYNYLQQQYNVSKLHPNSHLYTSDSLIEDFPGRIFVVEDVFSLGKKEIKEHLSPLGQANITVRNFPLSVNELRNKLKLKDGGDVYLFATTLRDERKVLVKARKNDS